MLDDCDFQQSIFRMTESTIAYFGYGSLVNLDSLRTPYISAHRATLKGWKRAWLSRPKVEGSFATEEGLAFLSVVPDARAEIDGLLIIDHTSSLPALDKREVMYERTNVSREMLQFHDEKPLCERQFLYVAEQPAATQDAYILRSYLDVVMQGYLSHFGQSGLDRFIETTMNFDVPIKEDRDNPLYPRAVKLSEEEIRIFSRLL